MNNTLLKDNSVSSADSKKKSFVFVSTIPLSLLLFRKDLMLELAEYHEVLAISSCGEELKEIERAGITSIEVNMQRKMSPLSDIKSLIRLAIKLYQIKPDIVHSVTPKAGLLTMMASWLVRIPIRVHSFTGLLFPTAKGLSRYILRFTDVLTCACATHVIPEGEGVKNDLINGNITSKDMRVLGNGSVKGVDLSYFRIYDDKSDSVNVVRQRYGIASDGFVFIYVGRVVRDKGIEELLKAFSILSEKRSKVYLLIVGEVDTCDTHFAQNFKNKIKLNPNIFFTQQWVEDVRPYYAASDALILPSYREGFPNVVLEAGAMGLLSIVTDINGSREIIRHHVNGSIIEVGSVAQLVEEMEYYLEHRSWVKESIHLCRKMIEDRFDASYVRQCHREFYKWVLSDTGMSNHVNKSVINKTLVVPQ